MSYRDADKDALIAKLQKENEELKKVLNGAIVLFNHKHTGIRLNGQEIIYDFAVEQGKNNKTESYVWNIDMAPNSRCGIEYKNVLIPVDDYDNFIKLTK